MDNQAPAKKNDSSGETHAERAKQAWQSAESAARYRQSRNLLNNSRSRREDAIIKEWLGKLPPKAHVLDLPCGTGRMIENITKPGFQYTGGDRSPHMMDVVR